MEKTKTLFQQLHDANEKIKNLKLMHNALNEDYNDLVAKLKEANKHPLINVTLNQFRIIVSEL